jgi:hypothetical protein
MSICLNVFSETCFLIRHSRSQAEGCFVANELPLALEMVILYYAALCYELQSPTSHCS